MIHMEAYIHIFWVQKGAAAQQHNEHTQKPAQMWLSESILYKYSVYSLSIILEGIRRNLQTEWMSGVCRQYVSHQATLYFSAM